jgi:hypothetical protein
MKYILSIIISGALVVSGFGQTRNVLVGTNNAVVQPTNFWSANASNARTGLGLGTAATNPATAFQSSSSVLSNLAASNAVNLTNFPSNIMLTNGSAAGLTGFVGTTNPATARTNLGLGWSALTNTDATNFRNAIGLGINGVVRFGGIQLYQDGEVSNSITYTVDTLDFNQGGSVFLSLDSSTDGTVVIYRDLEFGGVNSGLNAATTRTNLGIPWSGITNNSASTFRTALGLGTAATNAATAFQPSSSTLTNLAINNAVNLTNIRATNIVGIIPSSNISTTLNLTNISGTLPIVSGGTGATNAANARQNLGSGLTGDALFTATNGASARTTIGATTIGSSVFTLANPSAVRFLRINADNTASALSDSDFRTAIGLGTAATNPSSAFQPSSTNLNALALNNGLALTNINFSNTFGTVSLSRGGTGATNAANARVALELGSTNSVIFSQLDVQTIFIDEGGSSITFNSPTQAAIARTNLGLGWSALTNNDSNNFRNAIGLGTNNTVQFAQISASTSAFTYVDAVVLTIDDTTNSAIFFQGNSAAYTRTNLGLGWSALTNNNATNFRTAIGLGATWLTNTNVTNFRTAIQAASATQSFGAADKTYALINNDSGDIVLEYDALGGDNWKISNSQNFRASIGLSLSVLTNTNNANFISSLFGSNTNPVLVNTAGSVVSPTNFWQVAPISSTVQNQTNVTATSTNAATNSRNLFLFSLAPTVSGVTNTVTLPTNPATTFEGDKATITHLAQATNSVTAIRQLGAATNLITINQLDETVALIYRGGAWRLADNISYIEPIYFSGTNAATNAAASRTNLGLGAGASASASLRTFLFTSNSGSMFISDSASGLFDGANDEWAFTANDSEFQFNGGTRRTNFQTALFNTNTAPTNNANTNSVNFNTAVRWMEVTLNIGGTNQVFRIPLFQ